MSNDRTPTERAGLVTWMLLRGQRTTVRDLADELEMTPRGARYLLERLSLVLPIIVDDCGVWRVLPPDERS